jgi:ABC-type transport system involved in cytochrome c biogenesis ATPase subunit
MMPSKEITGMKDTTDPNISENKMLLNKISITNFRSIKELKDLRIEPLQALVGENNCGKSNILRAIKCFLTSGAGSMEIKDFNDQEEVTTIECSFTNLTEMASRRLAPHLTSGCLVLKKELKISTDAKGKKA